MKTNFVITVNPDSTRRISFSSGELLYMINSCSEEEKSIKMALEYFLCELNRIRKVA